MEHTANLSPIAHFTPLLIEEINNQPIDLVLNSGMAVIIYKIMISKYQIKPSTLTTIQLLQHLGFSMYGINQFESYAQSLPYKYSLHHLLLNFLKHLFAQ